MTHFRSFIFFSSLSSSPTHLSFPDSTSWYIFMTRLYIRQDLFPSFIGKHFIPQLLFFYPPLFYLSPLLKRFRSLGTHSEKLILCPKGIQHLERGMRTKAMKTDTLVLLNTNRMYLRTIQTVKNKFWEGRHFPRNYRPYRECRLVAT